MKRVLVLLLCMLACYAPMRAQTTLSAGDVAFIAYNSDNTAISGAGTGADTFAVILLKAITSGTQIIFTDGSWSDANGYHQLGIGSEGILFWEATSPMSVGDVIKVWGAPTTCISCDYVYGTSVGTISGWRVSLAVGGDQVFACQGISSLDTVTNDRFVPNTWLAGIHMNYNSGTTGTSNWDNTTISSSLSELPNALTNGTNAVWVYDAGPTEVDNARIQCAALSGTVSQIRAACNDVSNWDVRNDSVYYPSVPVCSTPATTWNGTTWSNGAPNAGTDAIIASNTAPGSFTCADLTINSSYALVFSTNQTVNINGDLTNNGFGIVAADETAVVNFASSGSLSGNAHSFRGQVTVASGATLTTNNLLTLSAANSSSYGTIGQSAGTISGNVTIERYVPGKRAFRFMGHPFNTTMPLTALTDDIDITGTGGASNGFTATTTNNPSAYWFDVTAGDNSTTGANPGWTAFTHTNGTGANGWDQHELIRVMIRGQKGQGLTGGSYTPSNVRIDMTGIPNQGDQVVTLTKGSGSNFVSCGNPFASGVQMNTVARSGSIGANYYVWDATMAASGAYVTNAFTTSYVLPPFAALFTTASASGTLTFEEADKATGGSGLFKGTAAEQNWVELMISDSNTKWDRLMIHLDDNAMDVEDNQDAVKLYNPNLDFFTLSKDGQRLAIDVRPYNDGAAIPLGLTAYNRYNKYVIKTGNFDIPAGAKLFLHDKYLNTKTELGTGVEYWFDVTGDTLSQGNDRFEINMVGKTTGIASTLNTPAKMQLVPNPAHNEVKVSFTQLEGAAHLQLTSVTGRVVYSEVVNTASGSVTIPLQAIPAGMYIVELQSTNARFAEKLIKK